MYFSSNNQMGNVRPKLPSRGDRSEIFIALLRCNHALLNIINAKALLNRVYEYGDNFWVTANMYAKLYSSSQCSIESKPYYNSVQCS